ncbi:BLOC-2 complex member HPS5-like [Diadema setosum]|uniref:BLOC-2 complex member HPS5-like n=1 Tax=Diadema setosum TaxID=31175 RepID=UPI003B3B98C5
MSEGLTKAVFSPDENLIGLATSSGTVIVWKLNVTSRQKAEKLASSVSHRNRQVTSLCWDSVGLRLFSGDDKGRITITNSDSAKPSGLFKMQSEMVVDVDSSVVQMDFMEERLLISTMSRCYLCDPKKRLVFPIGSKPRDGAYGGCFLKKAASEKPAVFCARPGSRIWEANLMCQVLSTHQFKQLLATPPMPVVGQGREVTFLDRDGKHPSQSLSFPVLHPLGHHFLVTWNELGVYVFDPLQVDVVVWTNEIKDLLDVSISKSSLYCLYHDNIVRKYTLQTVARCAASLYHQGQLLHGSPGTIPSLRMTWKSLPHLLKTG